MESYLVCFVGVITWIICIVRADIFTSLVQFEQVLHTEVTIASRMREFIAQEEERLEILKSIADEYRDHSQRSISDAENYLSNPLNAYLLVKKFTKDWYEVAALIQNEEASREFLTNITSLPFLPREEDYVGASKALFRLQDTYQLDTAKLARGDLKGIKQKQELTGHDCHELGRMAYEDGDYYHAISWFQEALSRLRSEGADVATIVASMSYLEFSLYTQNNVQAALNMTEEILDMDPTHPQALRNRPYYLEIMQTRRPEDDPPVLKNPRNPKWEYHATVEFENYERLCRGETVQKNPFRDTLSCQYTRPHPFYILRPLKEEVMYKDPFIAVYHDLITDSEIAIVKDLAKPRLHRSAMLAKTNGKDTDDYRISKSAWVSDDDHWLIDRLSKKVSAATGLSLNSAEELQVLNYGIGGQYEPHMDFAKNMANVDLAYHFLTYGNRISTSLYYMSDVAVGGGTVFPQLGVLVKPEKGMMVMWYNLLKNGVGDVRTVHAGCPVLVGSKWVCNKWIHVNHQEFTRPCSTNPFE